MSRLTGWGLIGLLCAAILNAMLLAVLMPLRGDLNLVSFAVTFMVFLPYSLLAVGVVGLPLYILAASLEWLNVYAVLSLGLAAGLVVGGVFVWSGAGNWGWLFNMAGASTVSAFLSSPLLLRSHPKA